MFPWLPPRREPFGGTSRKASPERGGARHRRAEGFVSHTPHGRGGSVSRRDHNQAHRRRAQFSGGTNSEESHKPNASRSSGEGVWGGGASLREAASSPESPSPPPSFREGARGRGLFYRKGSSLAKFIYIITCTTGRIACRRRSRRLARLGCRRRPSSGGDTPSRRERCAS